MSALWTGNKEIEMKTGVTESAHPSGLYRTGGNVREWINGPKL
jgi:hypothetical protein